MNRREFIATAAAAVSAPTTAVRQELLAPVKEYEARLITVSIATSPPATSDAAGFDALDWKQVA